MNSKLVKSNYDHLFTCDGNCRISSDEGFEEEGEDNNEATTFSPRVKLKLYGKALNVEKEDACWNFKPKKKKKTNSDHLFSLGVYVYNSFDEEFEEEEDSVDDEVIDVTYLAPNQLVNDSDKDLDDWAFQLKIWILVLMMIFHTWMNFIFLKRRH